MLLETIGSVWSGHGSSGPRAFFLNSEPGFYLDFSSTAPLYQDNLAATPLTLPDQSVGMALDVSRGMALGPELVTNGGFDTDTAWTKGAGWTIGGGSANASSASGILVQAVPVVSGKFYLVGWSATFSAGQFQLRVGGLDGGYYSTSGVKSAIVQAGAAGILEFVATVMSGSVDNVSIREIQSLPARQASLGLRPKWGRMPKGGRRNRANYTDQFDNALWSKSGLSVVPNVAAASSGDMTVDRLVQSATNSEHYIEQGALSLVAGTYISTYRVRAETLTAFQIMVVHIGHAPVTTAAAFAVNTTTGVITAGSIQTGVITSSGAVPVGGGWYDCFVVYTLPATVTDHRARFYAGVSGVFLGDGVSSILLQYAQPESGSIRTPYQRVTNAFDVTEAGVPSYGYIRPDLMDDFLTVTTPAAQTGDVMVFGRKGTWLETGVTYGSGAAVSIGPTTMTGLPAGLLQAVQGPVSDISGGLVGVLAIGRTLTAAERTAALNYYKARGAAGLLVAGADVNPDPGFNNAAAWSFGGATPGWAVTGGKAECTATAAAARWVSMGMILTVGVTYLVTADVIVTAGSCAPDVSAVAAPDATTSGTKKWIVTASTATLQFIARSNFIGSIDNVTFQPLTVTP